LDELYIGTSFKKKSKRFESKRVLNMLQNKTENNLKKTQPNWAAPNLTQIVQPDQPNSSPRSSSSSALTFRK
jgi:hypothetical protein